MVASVLKLRAALAGPQGAEVDQTLRQWSLRARQMVASLPESAGPALDMLSAFSDM